MKKQKEIGITLIALVITIIVLLILAGVSIAILTGEDGILAKAKLAKERSEQAEQEENEVLKQYEELLGTYGKELPENTIDTEAGTIVKMPNGWYTTTPNEVETKEGNVEIPSKKIANVYATSDGKGNTIPVPYGFYYVGGTLVSGVVISDNQRDKNKYKGMEDVPAGVAYNSDGTVNKEKCELQGNQFVWIPCSKSDYAKIDFGDIYKNSAGWDHSTNPAEYGQIKKYGGFYVGRYEAGTSEIILANYVKFENASTGMTVNGWDWQNKDFASNKVESGKITSKAGEIPYYHADFTTAMEMSKNMYDTEYVTSGLITGTMWDRMMNFITTDQSSYSDLKSTSWGNYNNNTTVTYIAGQGRYLPFDLNNGSITTRATVADASYHSGIRTTASSEGVKKKNLYDMAGNLWEWTVESAYISITNPVDTMQNLRGGSLIHNYSERPVCYRGCDNAFNGSTHYGFRPALFMM